MSKSKVTQKAFSTKGKANQKPNLSRVHAAIEGIKTPCLIRKGVPNGELEGPDALVHMMRHDFGEYRQAAAAMRKSKDPELCELAGEIDSLLYVLPILAEGIRGMLAKGKSRADELEGR